MIPQFAVTIDPEIMSITDHIKDRHDNLKKDIEREGYMYFSKDVPKRQLRAAKNQASMRHIRKAHVVNSSALSKKKNLLPAFNQLAETPAEPALQQHTIFNQEERIQQQQQQQQLYQYHPYHDH